MRAESPEHLAPEAAELAARYPALTACRLTLEPLPSGETEAHLEILLPQHQIVLNALGADEQAARRHALVAAAARLEELAKRDPRILKKGSGPFSQENFPKKGS